MHLVERLHLWHRTQGGKVEGSHLPVEVLQGLVVHVVPDRLQRVLHVPDHVLQTGRRLWREIIHPVMLINQSNLDSGHSEIADRSATLSLIIVDIAFVKSNLGEASNTFASVKLDRRKVLITFENFATVCKLCHSGVQCQGWGR